MIINEIRLSLQENVDVEYQKFHQGLLPGINNIMGVRTPILRKIAKTYYKHEDLSSIIEQLDPLSYDEMILKALFIAQGQLDNRFEYVEAYLDQINNWAQCDMFCSSLKKLDETYFDLARKAINTDLEYHQRFGFVLCLNHFIDEAHIDEILILIENTKNNGYYSMMASAWLLSMIYLKFKDKTINFYQNTQQDSVMINKAIQKTRESFRVSKEDKAMLLQYKK